MNKKNIAISSLWNISLRRIIHALKRDGFNYTGRKGSQRIYRDNNNRRVVIHYHNPGQPLPHYVIRNLLIGTGWDEEDLKRLKLK